MIVTMRQVSTHCHTMVHTQYYPFLQTSDVTYDHSKTLTNCVAMRNACTTPPANAAQFNPPAGIQVMSHSGAKKAFIYS